MIRRLLLSAAALACVGAADAPAIHLDQVGFLPDAAKRAVVADPAHAPLAWQVLAADGSVAAQGRTQVAGDDAASGDHVHRIDFSALRAPGDYRLRVGGQTTPAFAIRADVFRPLALAALNFFYQQRAGVAIEARFAGGKAWARAAGHPREVVACFTGADRRGTVWPGCPDTPPRDVTGGWYDAGDHGKYVVNGGISVWTLQNLYETLRAAPPFPDASAALPEAGNGRDDLLDEARHEMRFLLAMQVPAGQRATVQARSGLARRPRAARCGCARSMRAGWRTPRSRTGTGRASRWRPRTIARSACCIPRAPLRR